MTNKPTHPQGEIPERVYLRIDIDDEWEGVLNHTTWCASQVNTTDAEYVHAAKLEEAEGLVAELVDQLSIVTENLDSMYSMYQGNMAEYFRKAVRDCSEDAKALIARATATQGGE